LNEYFTRYYGRAAAPMKQIYQKMEAIDADWSNYLGSAAQNRDTAWAGLGTNPRVKEIVGLFNQAEGLAQTDLEKQRLAVYKNDVIDYVTTGRKMFEAQEATPVPILHVPAVSGANGDPTKVDWSQAAPMTFQGTSGGPASATLSGRLAHDDEYLYFELVDQMNPQDLVLASSMWGDDWEIQAGRGRTEPYWQLGVGPKGDSDGTRWGGGMVAPFESRANVVSDRSAPDRWVMRVAWPLATLVQGGAKPRDTLRMNFFRVRLTGGSRIRAWSPTFGGGHEPSRFGTVILD